MGQVRLQLTSRSIEKIVHLKSMGDMYRQGDGLLK